MKINQLFSAREAAEYLEGKLVGDGQLLITGINEIHMVQPGDITFVDTEKYYSRVLNSAAGHILINKEVSAPDGKTLIVCADPCTAYNKLVARFHTAEQPIVESEHSLSSRFPGVTIYPGVYIGANVSIGKGSVIFPNVTIYDGVEIGENVIIQANATIGGHAYYYKKREWGWEKMISCGRVVIGNNVEVGAGVCIDKGVSGDTTIGQGTKIDNLVQIGHDVSIGERCLIGAQAGIAGTSTLEDDVIVWGQAGITKDVVIGKGVVVAAQAGVSKSISGAGKVYVGSPADEMMAAKRDAVILKRLAREYRRND